MEKRCKVCGQPLFEIQGGTWRHEKLFDVELGDYVKIILIPEDGRGERVWVQVTAIGVNSYEGLLDSIPLQSDLLPPRGSAIRFFRNNICGIEKL